MKKILLVVVIIVLLSLGLYIGMSVVKKNNFEVTNETNETEEDEVEKWFRENREKEEEFNKKYYISEEDIYEIAKSSPDWEKVDIAEDKKEILMKKYPNGILGGNDYDDMYIEEGYQNLISTMDGPLEFHIIATKGLKKDRYKIDGTGFGNFFAKNNFEIYEIVKFEITDENGNKVNSGLPMDEEHWISNIYKIAKQDDNEVGKSEDFYERYPNFTGILNPYHYESGIEIKWEDEKNDYLKKELFCSVYYTFLSEDYKYKVTYEVDEKNYLKDYKADIIEKSEHYFKSDNFNDNLSLDVIMRFVYNDRSFEKINVSKNFNSKFDNNIYRQFHIIEIYRVIKSKEINDKCILKVRDIDNNIFYLGLKYVIVNDKIDNVLATKLNIDDKFVDNENKVDLLNLF